MKKHAQLPNSPDVPLNCLLVYPRFSQFSFWNTREAVQLVGAKAPAPPLGLITVAAILPQQWNFRLLDLNTEDFSEEAWEWADLICAGGMLPQQAGLLEVIARAKADGKFIAVGGPDPTSQQHIYEHADALVVGEGEISIPMWLDSWRAGEPSGKFVANEKPDVTKSPIPRYDLLRFDDYYNVGVQYARGCPFNCEFCDIIELYGRKPRTKTPDQFLRELEVLYQLGYRGYVEVVDDNFIGNKRNVKRELLPALTEWNKARGRPFYFGTECSMNLADDHKLLTQMKEAGFRYVFMGIETPDPDLLLKTQKSHNTIKPIVDRVRTIYQYGIIVTAGFIIGFDGEKKGMDRAIIQCIEDTGICMAMIGLLVALPNTQLTRRLLSEGRLLSFSGENITESNVDNRALAHGSFAEVVDQTLAGLNFITTRDRTQVYDEFVSVVRTVYSPRAYMDRVLRTARMMRYRPPRIPGRWELKRQLRGLVNLCVAMTRHPARALFWRNFFATLILGLYRFEVAMTLMAVYMHFEKQSKYLESTIGRLRNTNLVPRDVAEAGIELKRRPPRPIAEPLPQSS